MEEPVNRFRNLFAHHPDSILQIPSAFSPPHQPDGQDTLLKANEMIATACREGSHQR